MLDNKFIYFSSVDSINFINNHLSFIYYKLEILVLLIHINATIMDFNKIFVEHDTDIMKNIVHHVLIYCNLNLKPIDKIL